MGVKQGIFPGPRTTIGYHSALPRTSAVGMWKEPSSGCARAASPEPGAHNQMAAHEFLRRLLNKPEFQRWLRLQWP